MKRKPGAAFACGSFTCTPFGSAREAVEHVLTKEKPLIVALGESHAQKGDPKVPSTTARFTEQLLGLFRGNASAMVLELWIPDGSCDKKTEAKVAQQQKEVTKNQAEENPNEFVKLGQASKEAGITPYILRPSCSEVETIKNAGEDAVLKMLDMITVSMQDKVKKQFALAQKSSPPKMVLTYGGAMHNDRVPKAGREQWSFAAELERLASNRYLELDLIVPEFIKDNSSWQALPWYPAYQPEENSEVNLLIETAPRSYALIFARTPAAAR